MKQYSHSFRTFNEAHEQITKTYAKALEVLRYCRTIHCYKVEWRSLLTVDMYVTEDNDPKEAYRKELQKLPTKHERSVRAIDQLIVDAKKSLSDLRTDVPPLVPFIDTYVRPELGDFLPTGDQYFFDFFDRIFADVESWALKCQKLYRSRKLDSRIRNQCEKLGKSFPLSLELEDQVRARLFEEEGRLVRLLKDSEGVFEDEGKSETISKADQVDECFRLAKEVVDILFDIRCHQQDDGIFGGVGHDRIAEMIPIRFLEADKLTLARQKLRFVAGEYRKAYDAVKDDYEKCLGRKKPFNPLGEKQRHFASHYFLLRIADPLVLRWAKKYESYLRLVPDDPESSRSCGKAIGRLNEEYPFDTEREVAFRERLSFEKSELYHCLATWNRSESSASKSKGRRVEPAIPAAMAEVEKIRQEALLASLSPKNRHYVFCGRIWSEYRRQQEALILEGSRKRTRGRVLIAEAFPAAKANGWPEDQLDEFIKCAKEGIKEGKHWTDFVKGSKGKKIPLEKFLT